MTTLTEVVDLFMMLINDYKLNTIYQTSGSAALNTYLEGWLRPSIVEFSPYCNQDLIYDTATQTFSETLTEENINLLAQIMVKYWLQREVQNVLAMTSVLQDHDYKTHSAAQNLEARQKLLVEKKEEVSQLLIDYGYKYNTWTDWNSQVFGG